jgi:hypothetical protein
VKFLSKAKRLFLFPEILSVPSGPMNWWLRPLDVRKASVSDKLIINEWRLRLQREA